MSLPQAESQQTASVLSELRRTTRVQHDRIEQLLQLEAPMPLARYGTVMTGFAGFLEAWEPVVQAELPDRLHPWFEARRRLPLALADLQHLGLRPEPGVRDAARAAMPRLSANAEAGLGAVLGSLYVIEGSALGGQVIAPRLRQQLGLEAGRGASYFTGFGERTGAMWREFRLLASAELDDNASGQQAACRSAAQTFEALIRTFEPMLA